MLLEIIFAFVLFLKNFEETKKSLILENDLANFHWQLALKNAPWSERDASWGVVFQDKIWILGGVGGIYPNYEDIKGDVWNSNDGIHWVKVTDKAPWAARRGHVSFVFQDKIWLVGGVKKGEIFLNDVWFSEDGINWTLVTNNASWLPRKGFSVVVFNNKIFLLGGMSIKGAVNDVWVSKNGKDWYLVQEHAAWSPRYDLAAEVFDNKIWISGGVFPAPLAGFDSWTGKKDVWASEDGKDWKLIVEEAPWPGRHGHCFLNYKNHLWIISGWSGYGKGYNDTWFSKDGANWQKINQKLPWQGREDAICLVFQDKIIMTSGMKTNGRRTNDFWILKNK